MWGIQASVQACLVNSRTWVGMSLQSKRLFICAADSLVLENDFAVFSAYGSCNNAGVSLIVRCSFDADLNVVFAGDGDRLIVADVAVKSFKFLVVAVYAPNIAGERTSFFFLTVGAIPRRSETASFSGWLECDPWSQDRLSRAGS